VDIETYAALYPNPTREATALDGYALPAPILDVGCGDGAWLDIAPGVGVDLSRTRVARARARGHDVAQSDARRLPFCDGAFGSVLCISVLEHIPGHEQVITEMARVLRDTGTLILVTPNYPAKRAYDVLSWLLGTRASPADHPTHNAPVRWGALDGLCRRHFGVVWLRADHVPGEGRFPILGSLHAYTPWEMLTGRRIIAVCHGPRREVPSW